VGQPRTARQEERTPAKTTRGLRPRVDTSLQINRATRNNVAGLLLPGTTVPAICGPVSDETSWSSIWSSGAGVLRHGRPSTLVSLISRPAHSLDMKTRSMLVELDVNNPKQSLAPGMFAEVQWPVSRAQASLFVRRTAVVRTSERQFVVPVRNAGAEWVDVRRGELNGDVIEVFGDLRESDTVIRGGNDEIRPGTKIATTVAKG
jgi:hypothetical protein